MDDAGGAPKRVWNAPNRHYGGVSYTPEQRAEFRQFAEQMLRRAVGTPITVTRALRKKFGIGKGAAGRLVAKILDEWSTTGTKLETDRARAQAIARHRELIEHATFERVEDKKTHEMVVVRRKNPDYQAIARLEATLMKLEGTGQPIKHDVTHDLGGSLAAAVTNLTEAERQEMLDNRREVTRLADLARRRLPEAIVVRPEEPS